MFCDLEASAESVRVTLVLAWGAIGCDRNQWVA